jgi:hypothetical protein
MLAYEQEVVQQLPEIYRHAKLLEVQDASYLIYNETRLPILGSRVTLLPKSKSNLLRNTEYLKHLANRANESFKLVDNMEILQSNVRENRFPGSAQDTEYDDPLQTPGQRKSGLAT